ncbi:MAG: DNA repair protein RadC [Rhodospirillales bacterium]|nr:DNA repair protein RadC [Rhodospirillales bacterium]
MSKKSAPPAPALAETVVPRPHHANHRQRLRARLLEGDGEAFADYELLELLLFYSIDRVDVKPLAKQLLGDFRSFGAVLAAEPQRLEAYPRVNERTTALFKAVREASRRVVRCEIVGRPVLSSWSRVVDYCRACLVDAATEQFRLLFLNRKNELIADEVQGRGTVDHTPVYPREVVKRALELGATALIMVHNHPSGDPAPSRADVEMTIEIRDAADKLGIALYDHIIVAKSGATSLKAQGLL